MSSCSCGGSWGSVLLVETNLYACTFDGRGSLLNSQWFKKHNLRPQAVNASSIYSEELGKYVRGGRLRNKYVCMVSIKLQYVGVHIIHTNLSTKCMSNSLNYSVCMYPASVRLKSTCAYILHLPKKKKKSTSMFQTYKDTFLKLSFDGTIYMKMYTICLTSLQHPRYYNYACREVETWQM